MIIKTTNEPTYRARRFQNRIPETRKLVSELVAAGVTRESMAAALGVTHSCMSNWFKGNNGPHGPNMEKLRALHAEHCTTVKGEKVQAELPIEDEQASLEVDMDDIERTMLRSMLTAEDDNLLAVRNLARDVLKVFTEK